MMDGTMRALKAHVRGGRLVLDEPTELPEGTEVELVPLDGDGLTEADRARLEAVLDESEAELDAGQGVGEDQLWSRLRAIR